MKTKKKSWTNLKELITLLLTKLFIIQILPTRMLHCPFTQQLCLPLATVNYGLVSEWVTRAKPMFLICFNVEKSRNSGQPWSSKFSTYLTHQLTSMLLFSVPVAKYSPFTFLGVVFGSSLQSTQPLFHTIPCKLLVHRKACFVGLHFLEDAMSIPEGSYHWKLPIPY